jgi:hypothetical protein
MSNNCNKIETAPKDRPIFVFAKWAWEKIDRDVVYEWRLAEWCDYCGEYDENGVSIGCFSSVTSNPYKDFGCDALYWMDLPTAGGE